MKPFLLRHLSRLGCLTGLLSSAACSVGAPGGTTSNAPTTVVGDSNSDGGDAGGTGGGQSDAGTADVLVAPINQNNKLCVVTTTCDPDSLTTASACHLAPDGGVYDPTAGYGDAGLACRVQPSGSVTSNGVGEPTTCSVAGPQSVGEQCGSPTDCEAELDCVGEGTCRRYCCAGNSQCADGEFCDVQPLTSATTTEVPVCMPIQASGCSLMSPVACVPGKTCTIVREDGTTGCVEPGPMKAGESCDTEHCGDGLVCLGALNARLCYALCKTSGSTCSAPQTCQGGLPLFQDPTVGVCR